MHQWLIIHRDLKPQNLFIQLNGTGRPNLCIGDFGLSCIEKISAKSNQPFSTNQTITVEEINTDEDLTDDELVSILNAHKSSVKWTSTKNPAGHIAEMEDKNSYENVCNSGEFHQLQRTKKRLGTQHFIAPEIVSFANKSINPNQ